tara:strand:+ start:129268 stop:130350 length:1083 start_codon:yes stop_codon:yes gene_type:complete
MPKPHVYISKTYPQDNNGLNDTAFSIPAQQILQALNLDSGNRGVMIKPNITAGAPRNSGIVTHPAFVGGIVDYFTADLGISNKNIFVGEASSKLTSSAQREVNWNRSGYTEMSLEKEVQLLELADYGNIRKTPGNTVHLHNIGISRWADADNIFYINVPKLKTHNLSIATLCGKNQQGVMIPVVERHLCSDAWRKTFGDENKKKNGREWMDEKNHEAWQRNIAHMHWDVFLACQPNFNIVEGIVGRDGNAFYLGRNFPSGLVIAGESMPAVDLVAAYLMGFEPKNLIYLQVGIERGLCPPSIDEVAVHLVKDGTIIGLTDPNKYRVQPAFEVYRDIPSDYKKKALFDEYDPNADDFQLAG